VLEADHHDEKFRHEVFPNAVLPRIKKDLLMHVGDVFDVVTQAHKPYGGAPQAYYYAALAQYFQRLGLDGEALTALPAWIEQQALTAHGGEEGVTAPPVPTEAVEEWDEFRREERSRIFERIGKSLDDERRRVLDHPLVGRLSLNDFAALARALGGDVDWYRFINTWHALEQATGEEVTAQEVVNECMATAFTSFSEHGDEFFSRLTKVSEARDRAQYMNHFVRVGDAFGIETPEEVQLTEEQRGTYERVWGQALEWTEPS
jgi:hypothetical protein